MTLSDHPGNLGAARGTLLTVIHADWPAYPLGDGWFEPLFQMSAFPRGTEFLVADDIDRALLMTPKIKGANLRDLFSNRNFHVAAWHDDLAELLRRGLLSGLAAMTEQQWDERRWAELQATAGGREIGFKDHNGNFVPIKGPSPGDYDDDPDWRPFIGASGEPILVTNDGRKLVEAKLQSSEFDIANEISLKIQKLYELGFYDTSVRDACVQLEYEIKDSVGTDAWGERLMREFTDHIRHEQKLLESEVRTFTQEVRALFKFIRNTYMHNLAETDALGALVALVRIARARSLLHSLVAKPGATRLWQVPETEREHT